MNGYQGVCWRVPLRPIGQRRRWGIIVCAPDSAEASLRAGVLYPDDEIGQPRYLHAARDHHAAGRRPFGRAIALSLLVAA